MNNWLKELIYKAEPVQASRLLKNVKVCTQKTAEVNGSKMLRNAQVQRMDKKNKNVQKCPILSNKQLKCIVHILQSQSIIEGCKRAKVSRSIFYLWLKNPIFKEHFERQKAALLNELWNELRETISKSLNRPMGYNEAIKVLSLFSKGNRISSLEKKISLLTNANILARESPDSHL